MTHKNHIEQLIHDLCPNGVNYMPLGEVCRSIRTGLNPRKNFVLNVQEANLYYVTVKEITTGKIAFSDKTDRITKEAWNRIQERSMLEKDDILFSGIGTIGKVAIVDIPTDNWNCSESVFLIKPKKDVIYSKYLMYYLGSNQCKEQYETDSVGSTLKGVRKGILVSLSIPLPPVAIQKEIVRILDAFANLIENIDNEIKERERQLGLYLVAILEHIKEDSKSWYKLGDICYQPKERISAEELSPDNYIGVENMLQNKQGVTSSTCVPSTNAIKYIYGDILLGNIRPNLRKIWMADRIGGTNGDVVTLRRYDKFKEFLFPRYLYYILSDESFFVYNIQYSRGAKMPRGNKEKILAYPIPLPSLAEQRAIAEKLDTIEAFIANLKEERALRQQQYEYYREYLINLLK